MTARRDWRFQFPAQDVADAAGSKAKHHRTRRDWWKDEQTKAETTLRESGLTFRDQPITGGSRLEAVLDPTIQRRVEECRQRVEHHETKAKEYETWASTLDGESQVLELDVDDVQFFGLKETP